MSFFKTAIFGQPAKSSSAGTAAPTNYNSRVSREVEGIVSAAQTRTAEQQSLLQKQIKQATVQAKHARQQAAARMKEKDKTGALMWMKKAMLFEKRRTNLMAQSNNLEMVNFHLVGASMMKEQAETMRMAQQATSAVKEEIDIDKVEDMMADLEEDIADLDAVQDIFGRQLAGGVLDDDAEAELAQLMAEIESEEVAEPATAAPAEKKEEFATNFPDAPESKPADFAMPQAPTTQPAVASMLDELAALESGAPM